MKKAILYLNSILFSVALVAGGIWNFISHNTDSAVAKESRKLTDWPSWDLNALSEGKWTRQVEDAFADRFMFRSHAMGLAQKTESLRGLPGEEVKLVTQKSGDLFNEQAITKTDKPGATDAAGAPPAGQWVNQMLIIGKSAYGLVGYSDEGGSYYAQAVNTLASKMGPTIKMYSILVPTAIEFLDDERYTKLSYPQEKGIGLMYGKLNERVKGINVVPALREHRDEYIYFRTDHHWTARGAYYAYRAAGPSMGYTALPMSSYQREEVPGFVGSLTYQTHAAVIENNPDVCEIFYPPGEHTFTRYYSGGVLGGKAIDKAYMLGSNRYTAFIAGDVPRSVAKSTNMNGRKILILKDSYGNAFIPFLIPHFQEIHIIDPRYWDGSLPAYVKEQGITDVLVFNCFQIVSYYGGFAMNLLRVTGK
jgi:hypothetical protein